MTMAVMLGLAAGLATIGLSEALLRFIAAADPKSVFRLSMIGAAFRATWVLGALIIGCSSGRLDPAAFTASLLLAYLIGQVLEGMRYCRYLAR